MLRVAATLTVAGSLIFGLALGLTLFLIYDSESSTRAFLLFLIILPTLGTGIMAYQVERVGVSAMVLTLPILFGFSAFTAIISMFGLGLWVLVLPVLALCSCVAVGLEVNRNAA